MDNFTSKRDKALK